MSRLAPDPLQLDQLELRFAAEPRLSSRPQREPPDLVREQPREQEPLVGRSPTMRAGERRGAWL